MDVKHWILFGAGLLLAVSKYVAANLPAYAPFANVVETLLAALMGYLGVTSPKAVFGSSGRGGGALPSNSIPPTSLSKPPPPEPPAAKRETLYFPKPTFDRLVLGIIITALSVCSFGATLSCTAAQWQTFETAAAGFISYVQAFVQGAEVIWAMISPLLGSNAPTANAAFNDAMLALTNAIGVFQDAVQAANATQQPLDLAALMKPVQDAVARVMAVVSQWQSVSGLGAPADGLAARANTIARWH